jgi:hypothetical protein
VVAPLNFTLLPTPSITGDAESGSVLEAITLDWNPVADSVSYAWRYLGSSTVLSTGITYEITDVDVGKAITVTVTGSKDGYQIRSIRSSATSVIRPIGVN